MMIDCMMNGTELKKVHVCTVGQSIGQAQSMKNDQPHKEVRKKKLQPPVESKRCHTFGLLAF